MVESLLVVIAIVSACLVGAAAVVGKGRSLASWCFFAGLLALSLELFLGLRVLRAASPEEALQATSVSFLARSLLPGIWLCFSLTYCRGNAREFLLRWKYILLLAVLVPVLLVVVFRNELLQVQYAEEDSSWWISYRMVAKVLTGIMLVAAILVLVELLQGRIVVVGDENVIIRREGPLHLGPDLLVVVYDQQGLLHVLAVARVQPSGRYTLMAVPCRGPLSTRILPRWASMIILA